MGARHPASPISLAVIVSVMSALVIVFFLGSLVAGYALMTKHLNDLQAQQRRQGIPICRALKSMAEAGNGAIFSHPNDPRSYGKRLSVDIVTLYETTGCEQLTGKLPS